MNADQVLAESLRQEWGRLTSLLLRRFRRLDLVEDALGDAFESASRHWPVDGVPTNPAAWLHTAARRRVLDRLRAETMARSKEPLLLVEAELDEARRGGSPSPDGTDLSGSDDLVRMALMCAHPALDPAAASALTLRLVLGLPTSDIATLFLVSESTMAARITRAKKKIVAAGIPFAMPQLEDLADRLDTLAQTAYLAFTAGYAPRSGADVVQTELAGEAIRLVRVLLTHRPDEPVLVALLALTLLQHSRRDARVDESGELVLLGDQDRSTWHRDEITEATGLLQHPGLSGPITVRTASYVLQARIAAEHALASDPSATRWREIVQLYDALLDLAPTPSARLARAVAVAESEGPTAGLTALDGVEAPGHKVAAVRAELLARAGRTDEANVEYGVALSECRNEAERAHLSARRAALAVHGDHVG